MQNRQQVLAKLDKALEKMGEVQPKNTPSANRLKESKEKVRSARADVAAEPEGEPAPAPESEPAPPPPPPPPAPSSSLPLDGWGARMEGKVYGIKPDGVTAYTDAPWDGDTQKMFESHVGRPVTRVHWGQPWLKMDTNALSLVKSRGARSLVTLPLPVDRILSGSEDATIDAWAKVCATWGGEIVVRPGWEMNGNWYRKTSTNPDGWGQHPGYVEAWRHFVNRVRNIAPNVYFCWCVNILGGTSVVDPQPFFPGEAFVNYVGIDGYNFGGTGWVRPSAVFKPTYTRVLELAPQRKIFVCETGCAETGGDKAAWITEFLTVTLEELPQIRELYWFNSNLVENGAKREWPIESSPAAQTAFAAGIKGV